MLKLVDIPKGYAFSACLVLLTLAACSQPTAPAPKQGSPEALLNSEGSWKLVEEKQVQSPEQKHMSSRLQVNPKKSSAPYTEEAKLAQVDQDVHFRVLRLERQMNTLRSDFDKILPPLAAGAKAEADLGSAIAQIQTASGGDEVNADEDASSQVLVKEAALSEQEELNTVSTAVPESTPARATTVATKEQKPEVVASSKTSAPAAEISKRPQVPAGSAQVTAVRTGEHPGSTRLVLDISSASSFSADLDSAENLLVVELPSASWGAAAQKSFGNHALLKGYSAQPSGKGTRLVVELKKPAKLKMKSALPANEVYGNRIVFDIAPL